MFVQRLTDDCETLLQAIAVCRPIGVSLSWRYLWGRCLRAAEGLPLRSLVWRVTVSGDGEVRLTISATIADRDEAVLRNLFSHLASLEGEMPGSVSLPLDADGFENMALALPPCRRRLMPIPTHLERGSWLVEGRRLLDDLPALIEQAVVLGHEFGYQIALLPGRPSQEAIRAIGHNAAVLAERPGLAASARATARRQFDLAREAVWLVEEVAATGATPAGDAWLAGALARLGMIAATLPPGPDDDELGQMLHSAVFDDVFWAEPHRIATHVEGRGLLAWLADLDLPQGRGCPAPGFDPPAPAAPNPPSSPPSGPFCFISYRRDDFTMIRPLLDRLAADSVPFWYDTGILAGDAWLDALGQRLHDATAVVAWISPGFVTSRYCRREVMFADILGKPILPVMLAPSEFDPGLGFVLHARQILDVSAADFWPRLLAGLAQAGGVSGRR